MKQITRGFIIYNKIYKSFLEENGELVETMYEATFWLYEEHAKAEINKCDFPDEFEIWEIIKTIETV